MAGHWPQHLPPNTAGEAENGGLQELPCGQGKEHFHFLKIEYLWTSGHFVTQSSCYLAYRLLFPLNLNVPSPSGTLVTAMSLSCQIIEDLITSSDSTTMSLNIIPGMPS